ncbi:hypothetical protein PR003_g4561 [Phytophthora rubi]|uniref:Uncharacterized protein n=1 Tax=Phytophthora rubi TaxID=129364 RepID=A0A6A4G1L8_9STRA|nr:hypothetical protein PR002_g5366 [Phytophthora rubi]KAE9045651.1 hypothetical protein PR001_g4874 [Phytophthora rubi]KAE9352089.1 hypothetical protein PR003_g4561 [Phytophthora rubi]
MGAGPSLGKYLKIMDDEELSKLVDSAYKLDPQRMEKMFTLAKMRYYEELGQPPPRDVDAVDTANALSMPAALLSTPQNVTSQAAHPMLSEMLSHTPATTTASSAVSAVPQLSTVTTIEVMADSADEHAPLTGVKDPMNALWTFEGHHLRELQTADKNPHNANNQALQQQGLAHTDHLGKNGDAIDPSTGVVTTVVQREVDADGYPILYGSCGRDKRYGRCSVCYFRGLRCNTAHYCACCQRPVCIRPRKYPGEEHQKICWNVLHMDNDMIQRVEKKKKRKLQALTTVATTTPSMGASSRLKNIETGDGHGDHSDRANDTLNHSTEDLHPAPSIPTVVADVSGAVDL